MTPASNIQDAGKYMEDHTFELQSLSIYHQVM